MPDKPKTKKLRIYKYASEYNLSTEALMEFLKEEGYKINSHMSVLSDEMLADIGAHFKKDIEKAEVHYRKISEFQKLRVDSADRASDEEEAEVAVAEVKNKKDTDKEEVEVESTEVVEEVAEEGEAAEEEAEEAAEETDGTEEKVEAEDETVVFKTKTEMELDTKKKGLTILGKMDLFRKKKKKTEEETKAKDTKDVKGKIVDVTDKAKTDEKAKDDETEDGKKRKKKRLKAKAKKKINGVEENIKAKKFRKVKKEEVDKKEVEAAIKRTILSMDESSSSDRAANRKKKKKEKLEEAEKILEQKELEKTKIKVTEFMAINEIANLMGVSVAEVIQKCIGLGLMVSINQRLDVETITFVADEFGFEVEFEKEFTSDVLEDVEDEKETLMFRPPVVTIMGHVDHGKTSLLDYIRKANVVAGESGGITQHIGAYQVEVAEGKMITFLDTPGHEAFTAMRARGASVTDIVILIVAADDAVMPQTVEAINHAQAANVPIIVAVNKIDKPGSNVEKIKQQLADRNVLVEDWGGKHQCIEVSAKMGTNIDVLLEKILLEAEILELTANPDRNARGAIIETKLEMGRGTTSTVLVQKGTLKIGDPFVAGIHHGRVRAMFNERNQKISEAPPSAPVVVLGFEGSPQAGDLFVAVDSERDARDMAIKRQQIKREQDHRQVRHITLDEIARQISQGGVKELAIIVKGDVDGSVEALSDSLMKLSTKNVVINVIQRGVGGISESDVLLASASNAIIVGFHVRPHMNARKLAEEEKVDIRIYNVIYDAIGEVKSALEGLLEPLISEELVATIEIRDTFKVPKIGTVAGCYVQDGKITRADKIRLFREGIVIYEGQLASLKRFKDDVKEVDAGYECGLNISNFNDIKVGDIIESYKLIETKQKLD